MQTVLVVFYLLTSLFLTEYVSVEDCGQVFTAIPIPPLEGLQIVNENWQDTHVALNHLPFHPAGISK